MRLATFSDESGQVRVAQMTDAESVRPLAFPDGRPVTSLVEVINSGIAPQSLMPAGKSIPLKDVRLLAPIPMPARNLFCVGKNYFNHAREFTRSGFDAGQTEADAIPANPIFFSKTPQTVVGHGEPVWNAAGVSDSLDYEAELAVIIGKGGRGISKADALKHVWGYTILNDVTARDWQKRHKQWHVGKSFDTFGPMGPIVVSADEIDSTNLSVKCWINGELRQDANTRDLIFDVATLIETLSAGITLIPGDILATGTPEGVGIGFKPPRFLKPGDLMTIEISGIGRLENRVGA